MRRQLKKLKLYDIVILLFSTVYYNVIDHNFVTIKNDTSNYGFYIISCAPYFYCITAEVSDTSKRILPVLHESANSSNQF